MGKEYNIILLKGDGIGPEVLDQGVKVLNRVAELEGFRLRYNEHPFGAEYYLKNKTVISESAVSEYHNCDAVYLGALGDPRVAPGILEIGLILRLRFELDEYVNLRPVKLYPNVACPIKGKEGLDFYIIRENTEDFYNGMGKIFSHNSSGKYSTELSMHRADYDARFQIDAAYTGDSDFAINMGVITRKGANRVQRYAFELAKRKGKTRVTSVDKVNVLPHVYGVWREEFQKLAAEYPDIAADSAHVDATTMWLIKNPESFGVMVAPNLFGDIITDLGAAISGGLGFAAGANINPTGVSMFEPIHGSAPKYAGKNIANPIATILSGVMMLDTLGETSAAAKVEQAVCNMLRENRFRTKDMGGATGTSEMGDEVVRQLGLLK